MPSIDTEGVFPGYAAGDADCAPRVHAQKVYVQDRLRESGKLVWDLLEAGGHFYVCGDAAQMAGAVERELLHIIESYQVSIAVCLSILYTDSGEGALTACEPSRAAAQCLIGRITIPHCPADKALTE